jgi:hypothetical protein
VPLPLERQELPEELYTQVVDQFAASQPAEPAELEAQVQAQVRLQALALPALLEHVLALPQELPASAQPQEPVPQQELPRRAEPQPQQRARPAQFERLLARQRPGPGQAWAAEQSLSQQVWQASSIVRGRQAWEELLLQEA